MGRPGSAEEEAVRAQLSAASLHRKSDTLEWIIIVLIMITVRVVNIAVPDNIIKNKCKV